VPVWTDAENLTSTIQAVTSHYTE